MSVTRTLPSPEALRSLLGLLLDRPASVSQRRPARVDVETQQCVTARYCRDDGALAAACITDVALAATAGAALGLVPTRVSEAASRKGVLDGALLEHFHEVANVFSSILNAPGHRHLRLADVVNGVPADVGALLSHARMQRYDVGIGDRRDLVLVFAAA